MKTIVTAIIVALISMLLPSVAGAQDIYDLNRHYVQPEYQQLRAPEKAIVDATGSLNLSIPIMEIKGRGIDYPVQFHYKSGIKVLQPSNWIGLGWSFDPGSISRRPVIGPPTNNNVNGVDQFSPGSGTTPDIYTVNIPGVGNVEMLQVKQSNYTSSTIPVYQTGDFVIMGHKAWKVRAFEGPVSVDGISTGIYSPYHSLTDFQYITELDDIHTFVITVENGTRYVFQHPTLAFLDAIVPSSNNLERHVYVGTWRLAAVLGPEYNGEILLPPQQNEEGSWVRLEYQPVETRVDGASSTFRQSIYLSHVVTPLFRAEFITHQRAEPIAETWEYTSGMINSPLHKKLTQILLYNDSNSLVRRVSLQQSQSLTPTRGQAQQGRLALDGIKFFGIAGVEKPGYTFEYHNNPNLTNWTFGDPSSVYHDLCIDDMGYFNQSILGYQGNHQPGCGYLNVSGPNTGADAWSLSMIEHPTDLFQVIDYETRKVHDTSIDYYLDIDNSTQSYEFSEPRWFGGPRVVSIVNNYGQSKSYYYEYGTGMLSGIPERYFLRWFSMLSMGNIQSLVSGSLGNARVYYDHITMRHNSNKMDPRYQTHYLPGVHISAITWYDAIPCPPDPSLDPNVSCQLYFVFEGAEHSTLWGYEDSHYSIKNGLIHSGTNNNWVYQVAGTQDSGPIATVWDTGWNDVWGLGGEVIKISHSAVRQKRKIETKAFFPNADSTGMGEVRRLIEYEYDKRTNMVQSVKNSDYVDYSNLGDRRITEYVFAHDIYPGMREVNMLAQHARINEGIHQVGNSELWHTSVVQLWKLFKQDTFWAPWRSFMWKADQASENLPDYTYWSGIGNPPSVWLFDEEIAEYTADGHVEHRLLPNLSEVHYTYGNQGSLLTNVTIQVPGAHETLEIQLAYQNPHRKVSSIINPSGKNTRYIYDAFGRLGEVLTHDNSLLAKYQYHYAIDMNSWFNRIIQRYYRGSLDYSEIINYYDVMMKPIQSQFKANDGYVVEGVTYDYLDRKIKEYKPFFASNGNGMFYNENQLALDVTEYYKDKLNLSTDPHPYVRNFYNQDDPLMRIERVEPEWTVSSDNHEIGFVYGAGQVQGRYLYYEQVTDEQGRHVRTWYDGWGQKVRITEDYAGTNPLTTRFEYDGAGRLVKSINPRGQQTTWTYNTLGQLIETQSPDAGVVRYKYDDAGLLRFRQQANQNSWGGQRVSFYQYDFAGRLVLQGEASADFTAVDPNQIHSFEEDESNWLGLVHYGEKPPTGSYPWSLFATRISSAPSDYVAGDNVAARAWKSNGAWQVETFSYDVERRPAQKRIFTQGMSSVDTRHYYQYDRQDNLVWRRTRVGSSNYYHWYEYDKLGRLERIYSGSSSTQPSLPDVTYTYTLTGQVKTKQFRGNQPITYSYSIRDRMKNQTMTGSFIAWNEYSPVGNITRSTYQQPFMAGSTTPYFRYDYNYDNHYRLSSANYAHGYYFPLSSTAAYRVDNLSYDAAGNILSLRRRNQNGNIVDNLSYSYQGSTNRLQLVMDAAGKTHGWQAGTTYYSYDASGNMTHAEEFDYEMTFWEYTRDTRNQVVRAAGWGSGAITDYRYNYAGHRYYKHVSGGSWEYYGLDGGVRTGLFGQATPGPIWNILTPSGRVIGRNPYNNNPNYYVSDHLGSTRVVVSDQGSIQEAYDYYPFGLPMPGRSMTGSHETPERFTGYYKDQESYLYYAQARMYNPAIGRFMSVDPILFEMPRNELVDFHGGMLLRYSPYNYTYNNPLIYTDPDGRKVVPMQLAEGSFSEAWKKLKEGDWKGAAGEALGATVNLVQSLSSPEDMATDLVPGGIAMSQTVKGVQKAADLIIAGNRADRGNLTRAGRSLQKHSSSSRDGSSFPSARGSASEINAQGESVLSNIVNNPDAATVTRRHARHGDILEIRTPDGKGARFSADGKNFIGFIEP